MSFNRECDSCSNDEACWWDTDRDDWVCVECAKKANAKGASRCVPARVGMVYFPGVGEDRFDAETHPRKIIDVKRASATDWMIYWTTAYADKVYESATVFHRWVQKVGVRIRK